MFHIHFCLGGKIPIYFFCQLFSSYCNGEGAIHGALFYFCKMRRFIFSRPLLLPITFLLFSCGNNGRRPTPAEKATGTHCFIRTEGKNNQDTAAVKLVITNELVSGKMINMPYEKDSRRGTIKGIKTGDTIVGIWTYIQEGMWDSLKVAFLLKDDQLIQKETTFDPPQGREVLPDTSSYTRVFNKVDCSLYPAR
jgi:hypothetical protein